MTEKLPTTAAAALALWREIAEGRADPAVTAAWVQQVARNIVALEDDTTLLANERAPAARRAIGLAGRTDQIKDLEWFAGQEGTARELAGIADLIIETGDDTPQQIKRKIEYQRTKRR